MKKIIYFLAVVGLTTIVACSDEEKLPTILYTSCQTCEVGGVAPDYIPEDYEVCISMHTIQLDTTETDGIDNPVTVTFETVYVDGADTDITPIEYFQLFCDNAYNSTPDDTDTPTNGQENCVSCAAFTDVTTGNQVAAQQVCQGTNGHAYVGDEDKGIAYADYLAALNLVTTCQ